MVGIERYVAIVPYQTGIDTSKLVIMNAILNLSFLFWWVGWAAFFTLLRLVIQYMEKPITNKQKSLIFFKCLAKVLGNSAGSDTCLRSGESLIMIIIGVFATISCILYTGEIFKQSLVQESVQKINTIAELMESNLTIYECSDGSNVMMHR